MAYGVLLKRVRPNGAKINKSVTRNPDSGASEGKSKNSTQQYHEKYTTMAREAMAMGDRVAAESYYQHAEHYLRIMKDNPGTALELSTPKKEHEPGNLNDNDDSLLSLA